MAPPSPEPAAYQPPALEPLASPELRVVGIGGAGVNAVNRMIEAEVAGVEFIAVNTDAQSLQQSEAERTLQIGAELTRGLGSGSDPERGRTATMEDYDRLKALLKGSDMVFITAGEGGGRARAARPSSPGSRASWERSPSGSSRSRSASRGRGARRRPRSASSRSPKRSTR